MNNCTDPNSHSTVRTMDGKRQCNCTSCINERVNLQSMRAKAQRRMMTGKRPNSLIAWLLSEEWTDVSLFTARPWEWFTSGVINNAR